VKERSGVLFFKLLSYHLPERSDETTPNLRKDNRSPGQDSKPGLPEYKEGVNH